MKQESNVNNFEIQKPNECPYCGNELVIEWELDHIIPKSQNGLNIIENLLYCCKDCNRKKRDFDLLDVFSKKELNEIVLEKYYKAKELCGKIEDKFPRTLIQIKVNAEEYNKIVKAANKENRTLSNYCKNTILKNMEN